MYFKPYYYLSASTPISTFTYKTLTNNPISIKGPAMYVISCSIQNGIEKCNITSKNRSFSFPESNNDKTYYNWIEERYDGAYMVYMDTDSTFEYTGTRTNNLTRLTCFNLGHL